MQEQHVEHVPADAAGSLPDPGDRCVRRPLPAPTLVPGGLPGGKLRRVADHIDANLGRELRLGELSGVVHMSPFHFARLFKRTAGVPPHRFVVRRRVDRAIELLAGGEHPIGEIARLVGFATPSHFTTVFRRITGVTPTEYRRGRGERTGRIPTEGAMRPPEVVTQLRHHHVGPMARPDEVLVERLRRRGDRGGGGGGGRIRGPGLPTRHADHRQSIGCGGGHAGRALGRGAQDSHVPGSRGLRLLGVPHQPIMTNKLSGRVAVVTGASTGIGLATAKRFVREGMDHVFITGRRKDVLDAAVADIGRNVTGVQGDVANLSDLDRLYEPVKRHNRNVDVIFANAGVAQLAPVGTVEENFFDRHFDANVKGLFFSVQKGLPFLNDGGVIVLTGSIADIKGFPAMSVYGATKAAVRSFARTWTNELRDRHIRVNVLSPGHIDTPIMESLQQGDALTRMKEEFARAVPLGRMGDPDEIAKAVSFLASDEASYVSGIELFVDGGGAQI